MARRRNLFSSRSRKRRRDYRDASIGPNMGGYDAHGNTHTARSVKRTRRAADAPPEPTQRRPRTYTPGEIGYVNPRTSTAETAGEFARRRDRRDVFTRPRSDISLRGIGMLVLAVVLAIAVAAGVASCVFQGSVGSRLALDDDAVGAALVAPDDPQAPYYALITGSFDDGVQPDDGPDVLMLARVDAQAGAATLVSIPQNLIWTLTDGTDTFISREQNVGGDAGLVQTVSNFAGVDIAHFAKIDAEGFVGLVDELGGIDITVTEEVDDPDAGTIYIPAGAQTLSGEQALTLCRAKNYLGGYETRSYNQMAVMVALLQKAASSTGLGATQGTLDTISGHFKTDLPLGELSSLLERFSEVGTESVWMARVPGYSSYEAGELWFSVAPSTWRSMMDKVNAGEDPNSRSEEVLAVNPADYTLTVKNGSGVTGAASQAVDALTAAGYVVQETGNTDQFAYGETLVIYKDAADAPAAQAVVDALGVGRVVEAGIYYEFDTRLQVIVGQDWKPRA